MPDDLTGTLSLRSLTLQDEKNQPIRISGPSDIRRDQWQKASQLDLLRSIYDNTLRGPSPGINAHTVADLLAGVRQASHSSVHIA